MGFVAGGEPDPLDHRRLLAARFVQWLVHRITDHIDGAFTESDAIVRSETLKHRHSVAQVIAWIACVVIYAIAFVSVLRNLGLPVTGIVAPATVIGAAIGFGAQRIVQDLLAGFFIIAEKQYAFGDTVNLTLTGAITTEALSRTSPCGSPNCGRTTGRW